MNLLEVLINPQGEELELGERALVCSAANVLQIGEFQLLQLAYSNWFGRDLPEALVDRLFASYMLRNEVPHWARHFARAILAQDEAGRLDPDHPAWHHDHDYRKGTPAGGVPRFYAAAGVVALAVIAAILAAGAAVTAPTSLLPPYFERDHLPNEAAPALPARDTGR
jgi:hypothetical protein